MIRRGLAIVAVVMTAVALVPTFAADETPPPIRQFDIATLERLGRAMYEQDQFAWKATDEVLRRLSSDETRAKLRDWVVVPHGNATRVRMLRESEHGIEVFQDVDFVPGAAPVTSEPTDRALSPSERAQHDARTLALKNIARRCAQRYNSVILPDPDSSDWLVWAMPATMTSGVIVVGGYERFTISRDGTRILRHDRLSRGCLTMGPPQSGSDSVAIFTYQYVSLIPVETYVFVSLGYARPIYVGTLDGKAWKIELGRISTIDMQSPDPDGFGARALAGNEETCHLILRRPDGKFDIGREEIKVISGTEGSQTLSLQAPPDRTIASVFCSRRSIVPAPNDYKVLRMGYNLMIGDSGQTHGDSIGSLEVTGGRVHFRMIQGDLTADEKARVDKRIQELQAAFESRH